jgi:hypothetical protein
MENLSFLKGIKQTQDAFSTVQKAWKNVHLFDKYPSFTDEEKNLIKSIAERTFYTVPEVAAKFYRLTNPYGLPEDRVPASTAEKLIILECQVNRAHGTSVFSISDLVSKFKAFGCSAGDLMTAWKKGLIMANPLRNITITEYFERFRNRRDRKVFFKLRKKKILTELDRLRLEKFFKDYEEFVR